MSSSESSVHGVSGSAAKKIVVGLDGSASSLASLSWAAQQARVTGSALEVVAAWEWPNGYGWSVVPEGFNPAHDAQVMLESAVKEIRGQYPQLAIEIAVVEGHPAPVLVERSRGASLLVVGSRGHGEFVGMLIGSTSEHCAANAHCPVLVYRGDAEE